MTGNKLEDLNSTDLEKNPEQKRDNWDNPIEFLFSCISMSVGLGNALLYMNQ